MDIEASDTASRGKRRAAGWTAPMTPVAWTWTCLLFGAAYLVAAVVAPWGGPGTSLWLLAPVLVLGAGPQLGFRRRMAAVMFVPLIGWLFAVVAIWRACAFVFDPYWQDSMLIPARVTAGWRGMTVIGVLTAVVTATAVIHLGAT